jgi:transketolase
MSHHATEDIAILRALPDVVVLAPGDLLEAEEATKAMVKHNGTCYLRLGRGGEKRIHQKIDNFQIGKAIKVKDGQRVAIFSTGAIFEEVDGAVEILKNQGIDPAVYTFPTVKPLDTEVINNTAKDFDLIVTVEEHNIVGGFGSAVAEVLSEQVTKARLLRIGLNDTYSAIVGSQQYLRSQFGIDSVGIAEKILKTL